MKRTFLILSFLLSMFQTTVMAVSNDKPFTVPELKEWSGGDGFFTPTSTSRIVCKGKSADVRRIAAQFAADYKQMFGTVLTITEGKAASGDFVFGLSKNKSLGDEGYTLNIGEQAIASAQTPAGLFWATRTLLQLSEQDSKQRLPKGIAKDVPEYKVRGFMLDCGRKYFPMRVLREYVKMMSYYKMNFFHVHLNDNGFKQFFDDDWNKTYGAFRMECETFPGLTSRDGYYTKQEFENYKIMNDYCSP